jgi:hypothetical protein
LLQAGWPCKAGLAEDCRAWCCRLWCWRLRTRRVVERGRRIVIPRRCVVTARLLITMGLCGLRRLGARFRIEPLAPRRHGGPMWITQRCLASDAMGGPPCGRLMGPWDSHNPVVRPIRGRIRRSRGAGGKVQ